jgi:hypothetical protein
MTDVYRVDAAKIMHETIDGEVIIVNLDNGLYYSTEGVGTRIWQGLAGGDASLDALIAEARSGYTGEAEAIASGVGGFVKRLVEEKLILAVPGNGAARPGPAGTASGGTQPFSEPVLQKFEDMEALLLVDPIHEVMEDGWPHVK